MLIDTHSHLNDELFNSDRAAIIQKTKERHMLVINHGFDEPSSLLATIIADSWDNQFAGVGMHPEDADKYSDDFEEKLKKWLKLKKTVALGEIGLDYHYTAQQKDLQKQIFARQLRLAEEFQKPVSIHSRDAVEDTFSVIKENFSNNHGGVMHSFNQSEEMLKKYLDYNMYFGISGPVTFKNAPHLKLLATLIPIDRLLLETDCPYLTPHPYRGTRNDPTMLELIARQISELRGIDYELLIEKTSENAVRLFGLNI